MSWLLQKYIGHENSTLNARVMGLKARLKDVKVTVGQHVLSLVCLMANVCKNVETLCSFGPSAIILSASIVSSGLVHGNAETF